MTNYREILRLHSLRVNNSQIRETLQCSRQTVVTTIQKAAEQHLSWPLPDNLTNEALGKLFYPNQKAEVVYAMPDCEWAYQELKKPGVTLSLLWYEYHEKCVQEGTIPYKITQFKKYCHDYAVKQQLTMHLEHKPGDIMQVDWAGDTLQMVDTTTGGISFCLYSSLQWVCLL